MRLRERCRAESAKCLVLIASTTAKVVLITGVSDPSSLGACIALAFLNIGFRVFATARSRSAEELKCSSWSCAMMLVL